VVLGGTDMGKSRAFHFSPRYEGEEGRMLEEVRTSFQR
jgi:ribonuclease BN (tRNA processing enzyme)